MHTSLSLRGTSSRLLLLAALVAFGIYAEPHPAKAQFGGALTAATTAAVAGAGIQTATTAADDDDDDD